MAELLTLSFYTTSPFPLDNPKKVPVNSFLIELRKLAKYEDIYDLQTFMFLKVNARLFTPAPATRKASTVTGSGTAVSTVINLCVACFAARHTDAMISLRRM